MALRIVLYSSIILHCQSVVICTSGNCNINCDSTDCNTIICTNKAASCTISCQDHQCQQSNLYLAAYNHNTVNCLDNGACDNITVYCGASHNPPNGYAHSDFTGHINKCNLVSRNVTMTAAHMQCSDDIDSCECLGKGCDQINPALESELYSQPNISNENNSDFIYILVSILFGALTMSGGICVCIRIFYQYKRKVIGMQLESAEIGIERYTLNSTNESESELILEIENVFVAQNMKPKRLQPHMAFSSIGSMMTIPPIPAHTQECNDLTSANVEKDDQRIFCVSDFILEQ